VWPHFPTTKTNDAVGRGMVDEFRKGGTPVSTRLLWVTTVKFRKDGTHFD
jgi:hypothetical protein